MIEPSPSPTVDETEPETERKPCILFVDDEQRVLDGLRDLLRKHRKIWDLVFTVGPEAALQELEARPFEVVISDMRMPNMDGARLLDRVRTMRPDAVRIVLSGQMEIEAAMRAVTVAHQFLTKPCDCSTLEQTIQRSLALHRLVSDGRVRSLVGGIDSLPSPPQLHADLGRVVAQPNSSARDVARIIERDPAMAAKILQLVNSSFFGVVRRVTTLEHAIAYLGVALVRRLVLAVETFRSASIGMEVRRVEAIQRASLLAASMSRGLPCGPGEKDDLFLATLLADIGLLLMASRLPGIHDGIEGELVRRGGSRLALERELLGVTHAEIGAYLLGLWGFPLSVVLAVARHHDRPAPGAPILEHRVWLATWLAEEATNVPGRDPIEPDPRADLPEPLAKLRTRIRELKATGATP